MSDSATTNFKQVISHAKEYGFIFQSSEIYEMALVQCTTMVQMALS